MKDDDWFGRVYRMRLYNGGERLMMALSTPGTGFAASSAYFIVVASDDGYKPGYVGSWETEHPGFEDFLRRIDDE